MHDTFLKHLSQRYTSKTPEGPSWPWSYGSWIYNYLCNQFLLPLMLWVRISIRTRCTTLCDTVCQWLATGRWFSPSSPVSSTNKTDRNDINEILLKVALNTIKQTNNQCSCSYSVMFQGSELKTGGIDYYIAKILLKVVLNTIKPKPNLKNNCHYDTLPKHQNIIRKQIKLNQTNSFSFADDTPH